MPSSSWFPKKNGKMVLVFNMETLNHCILAHSFLMVTLKMVNSLWSQDFVVSLDLLDAHFHLSIDQAFRCFLRFKFQEAIFQFTVMPFGLYSSPHLFIILTQGITFFCPKAWDLHHLLLR